MTNASEEFENAQQDFALGRLRSYQPGHWPEQRPAQTRGDQVHERETHYTSPICERNRALRQLLGGAPWVPENRRGSGGRPLGFRDPPEREPGDHVPELRQRGERRAFSRERN